MFETSHYEVELTDKAEQHYNMLDESMIHRINNAIDILAKNPFFGSNITKLKGELHGQYRYRVGSYRIVYSIDTKHHIIIIRGIFQRGHAYR